MLNQVSIPKVSSGSHLSKNKKKQKTKPCKENNLFPSLYKHQVMYLSKEKLQQDLEHVSSKMA